MHSGRKDTFWITNGYTTSRWPTRCTILIINFYSTVFSCSTCFERITRSSSGALPNILYHADWYNRAAVQLDSSARLYRLHCVIQYTKQCSWWWTSNSLETCRERKYGGIKIIYKNCESRWSSTHCNMMHGAYNVKLNAYTSVSK